MYPVLFIRNDNSKQYRRIHICEFSLTPKQMKSIKTGSIIKNEWYNFVVERVGHTNNGPTLYCKATKGKQGS